jgi:hypothetical protein
MGENAHPGHSGFAVFEEAGSRRAGCSQRRRAPIPGEMPVPRRLIEFEFSPAALVRRIVRGAVEHDMVRLHGSIVAAFEIYGAETAEQDVFVAARRLAAACSPDCHAIVAEAIGSHAKRA